MQLFYLNSTALVSMSPNETERVNCNEEYKSETISTSGGEPEVPGVAKTETENEVMKCTLKNEVGKLRRVFENPDDTDNEAFRLAKERNYYGRTAIEMACILGRVEILNVFAKYNVDLHVVSPAGYSLVHISASWGQINSLRFLDNLEVDFKLKTPSGETAENLAARYEKPDCEYFIKKANAKKCLKGCVWKIREGIVDPEKSFGVKLSKEDKAAIGNSCNEVWEWTHSCLNAPEKEDDKETTVEEIKEKQKELVAQLQAASDRANAPPAKKKPESNGRKSSKDKGKKK